MADSSDLPPPPSDPAPKAEAVSPSSPSPVAPPQARSGLGALWTLLVRLVILGTGVSVGWLAGMAVAQVWPARGSAPPMTEVALRHSSQTLHKLQQLPRWWQGNDGLTSAEAASLAESSAPEPLAASSPSEAAQQELPAADRDRIQADLNRLQQDLASLNTRLQTLETSLGESPTGTLEDRLQRLDQRLDAGDRPDAADPETPAAAPEPTPEPTAETVPLIPYPEPRFPLVSDRIVLPSALLFEPGSSMLTTPGQQLLDSIAPDLRRYGPVTLLVGSHTDSHPDPTLASAKASQLTLQQALAVQQHLAPQIEAEGVRWVILGYGYTRPRTTGITSADQQRNQRIEIGVVPGS